MPIRDKNHRLYGQLVIDFANAKTTEEAGLKYFINVRKAFGFSDAFVDKAKNEFSTFSKFNSSLNEDERRCFNWILEKHDLELGIQSVFQRGLIKYNIFKKMFQVVYSPTVIIDSVTEDDGSFGLVYDDEPISKELSFDEIRKMSRDHISLPGDQKRDAEIISSSLPALLELGDKMTNLKNVSEEKYLQLTELKDHYTKIRVEHYHIQTIQCQLKRMLVKVILSNTLTNNRNIRSMVEMYNQIQRHMVYVPGKGLLNEQQPFSESHFLKWDESDPRRYIEKKYRKPIAYCFVEFIRGEDNIKFLKRCKKCDDFIIVHHRTREFCEEPKQCHHDYYNEDRKVRARKNRQQRTQC